MALCAGVMTLCAASSLFVSCEGYDDSELRGQISQLDQRVKNLENLQAQLEALTARVDALYTLKFQVAANNELQYSFDGGKTWTGTGVILAKEAEPCDHECPPCQYVPCDHECPEVSLVDNGDSVTIKVGDAEFTIEKPQEIVFEIRAGKVYFESEGTMTVNIKTSGIEDVTVMAAPKGWWAEINSEGKVEITAPDYESTQSTLDYETWEEIPAENAVSGYVKVHACGADGKCMVGKIAVEVSGQPLVVKAYAGNAYFTIAGTSSWPPTFYYGISTKETLEADTQDLLKRLNDGDWSLTDDYPSNWGEYTEVTASIAELLGEEPRIGQDYIVWAVLDSYAAAPYDMDDLVYAYYSPLKVNITEVEAERTAYNVTVDVEVLGADSYVAVAMPGTYIDEFSPIDSYAEQMAMAINSGEYYGKLYTENYTGSALDIAANTSYSMTGNYSPDTDIYVLVLPLDGRSFEDYTAADVVIGQFKTSELTSGGSIDLSAKQIYEYMGEVYDYDIWDYVTTLIKLDPYTQVGVEVTPSSTDGWSAFYYSFLTEAQWADYGAYDEDLVDLLLEGWGMTPSDVKAWPLNLTETVSPATTVHFVAFIVDETGKYGQLAKVKLTSEELKKADFTWVEPYTTNLTDGILKNSQILEFTPKFEGGVEAASYKYVLAQTQYYNQWEGKDDAQMAEELFFSTSSSVKTISADELINGVLYVTGHSYGYPYYFAIVPIDADGNPGASAAILEYETVFVVEDVVTEGEAFAATEPEIKINLPADDACYPDGGWGDGAYYGYQFSSYDQKYQYYYELAYDITPKAGTEVCAVLIDADSYTLGADAATKAGQVWGGSLGSWNTVTTTEYYETSYRYFNHYADQPAPELYICVSWKDAEGALYYKQYDLQDDMQYYADKMNAMLGLGEQELPTPDGKQWSFNWTAMGMGDMMAVLDFGVSMEGQCVVAYDPAVMGAPEGTPYQIFNAIGYEFEPADATSGIIRLISTNMFGEEIAQEFQYYDLTDYSCYFAFGEDSFVAQDVDGLLTEVEIDMSGGIMQ